jgi:hypothetical protein
VSDSPIQQFLTAIDALDVDAVIALVEPDGHFLVADGRQAQGREAIRELVSDFVSALRSSRHSITAQWHQDNVWIAEVASNYELRDWLQLSVARAFIVRMGAAGIADAHIYGTHEPRLSDRPTGEEGMWVSGRWIPPL